MKKYLFTLLIALAAILTSCKEDKYSVYNYGFDHWSNSQGITSDAMTKIYDKIADEFIASGFVLKGYQIQGDDITVNDEQAIYYFNQNVGRITETTLPVIEKQLQGTEGAPFTVTVFYKVLRGSTTQSLIKQQELIIKVQPKPAN